MASLDQQADAAREELDAWTREIVAWHFSDETGCRFWLDFKQQLDWDPLKAVTGFDDLQRFGEFDDEWLRGGPVQKWVPRGLAGKPVYVFETGGTTGVPKYRVSVDDWRTDYTQFSDSLDDRDFPRGSDWLMLGPSGPRRLRLAIEHLAQVRGGICFCVDLDPRWVVKISRQERFREMEEYKDHIVEQALTALEANESICCLFTTPKLLEALCEKISLRQAGITGVFCGGTRMTPQFHRFAREELLEGAAFVPTYGNTLMGLARNKPFDPADNFNIIYHAPQPRAVLQVVDPNDVTQLVPYGSVGRVRLTTLTHEFFMPGLLERDEAARTGPCREYPWDGVANVRPFPGSGAQIVEGVY